MKRSARHRLSGGGFTLMEVLLALALTVVVMVLVLGALNLYRGMSSAGREQMEHSQLARSILTNIESDIRSVVYSNPESTSEATADGEELSATVVVEDDASTGTGEEVIGEATDPTTAYAQSSLGVVGDANNLILHVSRPSRDLNYSSLVDGDQLAMRTSDLQSVAYFLAVPGSGGLSGMAGDLLANQTADRSGSSQGLARLQGDRLTMNLADEQGQLDLLVSQTELLAPEVNFLQFRYFDGVEWYDMWDSTANGRLPNAIEITIGFKPPAEPMPEDRRANTTFLNTDIVTRAYRYVVAVPLAEPIPPDLVP